MFFYLINKFNYSDINCRNIDTITNYIIDNSNYTGNIDIIDRYCNKTIDKCIIDNNSSYFVSCNYRSIILDHNNENCVLFIWLTILVNLLLFFIYKGFLEQFIDKVCFNIWCRVISLCRSVDKPSYRYTTYNTL